MAATLIPHATIRDIEAELWRLDAGAAQPGRDVLRTRVLTHVAWVPADWEQAARAVHDRLGDRQPSRIVLLLPDRDADRDALDAEVSIEVLGAEVAGRAISSELIAIRLLGRRALAPASVVTPLLVTDLPVFLRWRGPLPYGAAELEQLVAVADRLVVDSTEWPEAAQGLRGLATLLERVAVSDIAWARTGAWRVALAGLWPAVAGAKRVQVAGPPAEAALLAGWLSARLRRHVGLELEPRPALERVAIGELEAVPAAGDAPTPADLLSEQLELFGRDPVYEEAVRAAAGVPGELRPR